MKNKKTFSHFDTDGKAIMVDISEKEKTERLASASASISMQADTLKMIKEGSTKKGDVLGISRIAGIMAAKKTSDLIPLCHPVSLASVSINFEIQDNINTIKIIEWAEIIKNKQKDRLEIYLSHKNDKNLRNIEFKGFGKWKNFNAS